MALFRSDFSLSKFIRTAKNYGLPTLFLEAVQAHTVLSASGKDGSDMFQPLFPPFRGRLSLSDETLESIKDMSPNLPKGEGIGIQTIYHEATHAYISLKKSAPAVKAILRIGENHYRTARLADNTTANDAERIVHEALGEYVGHRASVFWSTTEDLAIASMRKPKDGKPPGLVFWDMLRAIPKTYDREMGKRVFGYQNKGLFGQRQVETKTPIAGKLKEFCDRVILENSIPDQFTRVKRFTDPYRALCKDLAGFNCIL
ncbi:MAG: hypothetical protein KA712_17060 [Myxococcales bacterium]|nr:hypothetical protein [Myxococcales bacterium]